MIMKAIYNTGHDLDKWECSIAVTSILKCPSFAIYEKRWLLSIL